MSDFQKLCKIPVLYRDGAEGRATRTGNNAAWMCSCPDRQVLLGTGRYNHKLVKCCRCGAEFFVKIRGGNKKGWTIPVKVEQR